MTEQHKDFYVHLPLLYVSVLDSTGHPVALVLTGEPGFVQPLSDTSASIQPMQTLNSGQPQKDHHLNMDLAGFEFSHLHKLA